MKSNWYFTEKVFSDLISMTDSWIKANLYYIYRQVFKFGIIA